MFYVKTSTIFNALPLGHDLGGVSALAQEVTLDFTKNTWGLPTDYTKTAATYSNGTYKISFGASSKGHKFGDSYLIFGKSGATLSLPAFDFDVEKIVITGNKNASASVKQNIFVGDKAASTETTSAKGTNTYEIAEAYQAAGNIYTLKVLNSNNTQVTKIEIYKKGGVEKTSTTTTFGADYDGKTISLKPGESFTAPAATLTPAEAGTLAYSSSNTEVATVDATTGAVTLTGTTGKTTITAAFAGNDTYAASSASYTLSVAEALSLTGAGTKESPYTVADVLAIVNAGQQTTDNVYVKGIVSSVDKYYDKYKQIDYYIVDNEGDTEKIMAYNGKGLNKADFSSIDDLKVGDKVIVLGVLTKYNDIVELKRDNYIVEFWGENTKTETSVTFGTDYDGKTISLKPGESFTAPAATLTPAEAGKLAYTSSNTEVATVDAATGAVTLTGTTGKTTITAAFAGNDTYAASEASYTLMVAEALSLTGAGTKESPYTVADVLAIVNAGQQTTDSVYVKGIVSSVDKFYDNYGQLDYYLVDNEGDSKSIMAYNGLGLDHAKFTSTDDLKVGTKLIVFGVLTKYNNIVELARKNYIKEILGEDASKDVTVTVGEALYTTLYYSDRNLVVPENAKAYTYSAEFGNGLEESHRYNAAEVIPAGEAVVVFALGAGDYTFKATDTTGYDDDTNMLFGTDEETAIADDANYYFYKLSLDSNGKNVGFYWGAANGAAFTNGAHKAYLKVSKNQTKAKAFLFNGGATAIKTVSFDNAGANAPVFNMAGQRVDKSFKGIVIRNGKKFVK